MILDTVIKLLILIEVTLVLVDGLSCGNYKSIRSRLTYYSVESVYECISKIRNNRYNWRKVLGLPSISKLPLSREEKKYLFEEYTQNYSMATEAFKKLAVPSAAKKKFRRHALKPVLPLKIEARKILLSSRR